MEMELESIMLPGIDPQRPIVIAGPCSAETEEQVMETARGIADKMCIRDSRMSHPVIPV